MDSLQKDILLSQQPSNVNCSQLGMRTYDPFFHPSWNVDWLDLVLATTATSIARGQQPCFVQTTRLCRSPQWPQALTISPFPFLSCSLSLDRESRQNFPFGTEHFSVPWLLLSLCNMPFSAIKALHYVHRLMHRCTNIHTIKSKVELF